MKSFKLALFSILLTTCLQTFAMDLAPKRLDDADDAESYTDVVNTPAQQVNHGQLSFVLGYTRSTIKAASIQNLLISPATPQPITTYQKDAVPLNGITLGINQFLTKYFGYEFDFNYYLSSRSNSTYNGVYQPAQAPDLPILVNATATSQTSLFNLELLGMGGLHLSDDFLLVGKLGLGFLHSQIKNTINASFTDATVPYTPYSNTEKNNHIGLAGDLGVRYDLSQNFSLTADLNDLYAKKNYVAYQAGILLRL